MRKIITFEISEAAHRCSINTDALIQFIDYQWIVPLDQEKLLFDDDDIERILLILELREQMGVNDEGVPIILHLIDQINHLHLELSCSKESK